VNVVDFYHTHFVYRSDCPRFCLFCSFVRKLQCTDFENQILSKCICRKFNTTGFRHVFDTSQLFKKHWYDGDNLEFRYCKSRFVSATSRSLVQGVVQCSIIVCDLETSNNESTVARVGFLRERERVIELQSCSTISFEFSYVHTEERQSISYFTLVIVTVCRTYSCSNKRFSKYFRPKYKHFYSTRCTTQLSATWPPTTRTSVTRLTTRTYRRINTS
jgi:hypothetical protein